MEKGDEWSLEYKSVVNFKKIGERLRLARKNINLTQDDVAKKLKISREILSYYETGSREISLGILFRLSKVYGCSVSYILGEVNEPKIFVSAAGKTEKDKDNIDFAVNFVKNLYELETLTGQYREGNG